MTIYKAEAFDCGLPCKWFVYAYVNLMSYPQKNKGTFASEGRQGLYPARKNFQDSAYRLSTRKARRVIHLLCSPSWPKAASIRSLA